MSYTMEEIAEARERAMKERREQGVADPDIAALTPIADALNSVPSETPVGGDALGPEVATTGAV